MPWAAASCYCPASRRTAEPVSYTHLDVYKRQLAATVLVELTTVAAVAKRARQNHHPTPATSTSPSPRATHRQRRGPAAKSAGAVIGASRPVGPVRQQP